MTSQQAPTVYFNGEYLTKDRVGVSPDDRGFIFGDGVYEVVRSYGGYLFGMEGHLERMRNGLGALRMAGFDPAAFEEIAQQLLDRNGLATAEATVYLQVTRGAGPRQHAFPDPTVAPTVYAAAGPLKPRGDPREGVGVITVPDIRWARCDIKSVCLLPNVLANQQAREAGAVEAIFVRDGVALEATASSLFAVFDDEVRTAPLTNYILPSITRRMVLDICADCGLPARQAPIFQHQLADADELFLAGTTLEVMPIIRVDGSPVGAGGPGTITRKLYDLFVQQTRVQTAHPSR